MQSGVWTDGRLRAVNTEASQGVECSTHQTDTHALSQLRRLTALLHTLTECLLSLYCLLPLFLRYINWMGMLFKKGILSVEERKARIQKIKIVTIFT